MASHNYAQIFAFRYPNPVVLKCDKLQPVYDALLANMRRMDCSMRLIPLVIWRGMRVQHAGDLAIFMKTHDLVESYAGMVLPKFSEDARMVLGAFDEKEQALDKFYLRELEWGAQNLEIMTYGVGPLEEGMQAVIAGMLLQTWTIFESLANDLWEMAVNSYPAKLAELRGMPNRIENLLKNKKSQRTGEKLDSKKVNLDDIFSATEGTYDLGKRMGTLLKDRYKFRTLSGIRQAYSEAFDEKTDAIDNALKGECLQVLSLVRNLIVHCAGVADKTYCDGIKHLSSAPKVDRDKKLEITGAMVVSLAQPVINAGVDLLRAVDDWLAKP